MNRRALSLLLIVALCSLRAVLADAATPHAIKVQGFLTDRSTSPPSPADGTFQMLFEIYDAELGGRQVGSVGPIPVLVTEGVYEAELLLAPAVFDGTNRFVQMTVNGEQLFPRIRFVSVPYAFRSETSGKALSVEAGSIGTAGLSDGAVTGPKLGIVCAEGQFLAYAGGLWTCATVPAPPQVCPPGGFINCYTGNPSTLQVGVCRAGMSFCLADGRGFGTCTGEVLPAAEACGDGLDNDCDGTVDDGCGGCADADADGFTSSACGGTDCNDTNASIHPGATEVVGDGVDQDCNAQERCYQDQDNDGFGSAVVINSLDLDCNDAGEETLTGDCNDTNAAVHPAAAEACGDGLDNDCDGTVDDGC